jgi:hypothetical protein
MRRAMAVVWDVVSLIKKMFCCVFSFFVILNLSSAFLSSVFSYLVKYLPSARKKTRQRTLCR